MTCPIFDTFEVYGHTVPHWKALRYGKDESRELSCGSTSSICQGILKSHNLLHKQGFVETQSIRTVIAKKGNGWIDEIKKMYIGYRLKYSNLVLNQNNTNMVLENEYKPFDNFIKLSSTLQEGVAEFKIRT